MAFKRLNKLQIDDAADFLLALRRGEIEADDLPEPLIPETTADIQAIIDATNARIHRPVRGWKIYCVYKPMQPIFYTPIYDVIENGGVVPTTISPLRLIEPEIMFRVIAPMPRREAKYSHSELSNYLTAIVGMEVIGSRFKTNLDDNYALSKSQKSNYGALSDNIANGCIVVGDDIPHWRDVAFEDVRVRMTAGEETLIDFVGGHPFDDPFLTALAGVNRMRRHCDLEVGNILITSSSTSFFPAPAETLIRVEYEGLGAVAVSFAAN
jgi:2-keto-4-pentenoate hydratase